MSNDRELLELAAKAADIEGVYVEAHGPELGQDKAGIGPVEVEGRYARWGTKLWNPLTDDGDALRLAVKLNMDLSLSPNHGKWAKCAYGGIADQSGYPNDDPYAATRRAIVRAAAEIGKALP